MSSEFVALNSGGREIDWVDPYEWHKELEPGLYLVSSFTYEYEVRVPEGGSFVVRPMEGGEGD